VIRQPRRRLTALLILVIALASCGGQSLLLSFRVALASSGPLVTSLVDSGAIPQTKATAIINDFNDGAQCGLNLESAFTAIPKDLPEREQRAQKLNASVAGLRCFKAIVSRQNFATHPRVQQAAAIAEGILASLVVFYSESGEVVVSVRRGAVTPVRNEKELERKLKADVKALKEALEP
jgi:hypothetical protein